MSSGPRLTKNPMIASRAIGSRRFILHPPDRRRNGRRTRRGSTGLPPAPSSLDVAHPVGEPAQLLGDVSAQLLVRDDFLQCAVHAQHPGIALGISDGETQMTPAQAWMPALLRIG